MVYLVLEFRKEKHTFAKVEGGNVDFFLLNLFGVKGGPYVRLAYFFSKLINWLIVYRVIDDISQYVAIENLLTMLGYAIITLTACMRVYIYSS